MEKLAISRKSALLVLWSGVALGLAACGGDGSDTAAAPAPTPVPAPTTSSIEQIQALLDQSTANIATDLPSAGEDRYASLDSCYLGNGETKAYKINQWNADPVGSKATQAYLIGQTISGLTLSDESTVTNTDGSETRFATAHYKVSLKDGTSYDDASTVVYGNSAAVAGCAEPSNMPAWRFIGNQRQINAGVRGNTYIYSYWNLSDGSRRTPSGQLRREVQFAVRDPMKIATYLIVSGPGPSPTGPMTLKLISPRILRDAPEMRGLRGNANFTDTDTFQRCWVDTAGTSLGTAATADCTTFGASGSSVGTRANAGTDAATMTSLDATFESWGFVEGATYKFDVYADDGWKTVNGQSGKTPVASYSVTLQKTPYRMMDWLTPPASWGNFLWSPDATALAQGFRTTGGTATFTMTPPTVPAGGLPMTIVAAWSHAQGPTTSAGTSGWPRVRLTQNIYPDPLATKLNIPFSGVLDGSASTVYGEFGVMYSDRNGRYLVWNPQFY